MKNVHTKPHPTPRRGGAPESLLVLCILLLLFACAAGDAPGEPAAADLSPASWPDGDFDKYLELVQEPFLDNPEAVGSKGAVTGTYYPLAQRSGFEALRQGGSSVDAALTTALTQIALDAGAVISYFGILQMVHYDAATGEIVNLNAVWDTVKGETDPMSVPGSISMETTDAMYGSGEPSGRTVMVGGFMRGAEAAHQRYGRLPWSELFAPAIHLAEEGFPTTPQIAAYLEQREGDLRRLPESIDVFLGEDGEVVQEGDLFRQRALAATLRAVAEQGADYMYTGAWAEKAVAAVQGDGGHLSLEDLATYEPLWVDPVTTDYAGHTVHANGFPSLGGVNLIEALHLGAAAGIPEQGHWSESGESLREASDLTFAFMLGSLPPETAAAIYPGVDLSPASRLKSETAQALWERMEQGVKLAQYAPPPVPQHSDTVVAVDDAGNMTAITHSINSVVWGKTALIVDGVSLGDPLVNQKPIVAATEPGERLPDPIEVGLLTRDGEPVLAFVSMATGLHQQTWQSLTNVLNFGMTPKEAVDAPAFFLPRPIGDFTAGETPTWVVRVMEGAFPPEVLEASGLPVEQLPAEGRRYTQGLWVGISRDPESGELRAASHRYTNGQAFAH